MHSPPIPIPPSTQPLHCIDMHTSGMPTRLVISGYPSLSGSLQSQKTTASHHHDTLRRRILHEPRGHADAFGAILRPHTDLTAAGAAHMGVLYIHGGGYSMMCGHATIAVARFLVDCADLAVFPRREELELGCDEDGERVRLVLHTPAGLVEVGVPTVKGTAGRRVDVGRQIGFVAVPAWAVATGLRVCIPEGMRWGELGGRGEVSVSMAFCGTFILEVKIEELGFDSRVFDEGGVDFARFKEVTSRIKEVVNKDPLYREYLRFPDRDGYGAVFGVMVTDKTRGKAREGTKGAELGMYFFGENHIDRSPTGSAAAARAALDAARGDLGVGEAWTYHSIPTHAFGLDGMVATVLDVEGESTDGSNVYGPVKVQIEGKAYYTGYTTIVQEEGDVLGENGFLLDELAKKRIQ
ncbi:proline racemase [Aspergillus heterothallicus]